MRKGFTIIELLVASLLLGLLVTILTMIFNQSSIAWRIGATGTKGLDDVRDNMAELREEADNVFVHDGKLYRHIGLWDSNGELHYRAASGETAGEVDFTADNQEKIALLPNLLYSLKRSQLVLPQPNPWEVNQNMVNVGMAKKPGAIENYTVNVMSGGPNNDVEDWQAIWSFPDDPNEW